MYITWGPSKIGGPVRPLHLPPSRTGPVRLFALAPSVLSTCNPLGVLAFLPSRFLRFRYDTFAFVDSLQLKKRIFLSKFITTLPAKWLHFFLLLRLVFFAAYLVVAKVSSTHLGFTVWKCYEKDKCWLFYSPFFPRHKWLYFLFWYGCVLCFLSHKFRVYSLEKLWKTKKEGYMFLRQCHALETKSFFLCIFWTDGHILNVIRIDFSKRISVVFSVICTNNFIPFWDSRI
jgi:hypothetical protein